MDKAKGGRFKGGRQGGVGHRGHGGRKIETTVLEQQFKKRLKKERVEMNVDNS